MKRNIFYLLIKLKMKNNPSKLLNYIGKIFTIILKMYGDHFNAMIEYK